MSSPKKLKLNNYKQPKSVQRPKLSSRKHNDFLAKIYNYEPAIFKKIVEHLDFYDKLVLVSTHDSADDWLKTVKHDVRHEKPHGHGIDFLPPPTFPFPIHPNESKSDRDLKEIMFDEISETIYKRKDRLEILNFLAKIKHPILMFESAWRIHLDQEKNQIRITEQNCDELKYCRLLVDQKSKIQNPNPDKLTKKISKTAFKNNLDFLVIARKMSSTTA